MHKSLAIICVFISCVSAEPVRVDSLRGVIIGQKHKLYNSFFGIPYADVDTHNPFGSTVETPLFKDPFIANDSSILCPQSVYQISNQLQCLRLNIYVPHGANPYNNTLPILVWFHGGGFAFGSGGEYGGQHLVKHDILVITVNYRLGPYGFFCLNDHKIPGNQGLKDQIEALRWIKKNIDAFGGDPEKVTIAGESYGGGAVDLHLYSEYEVLFDKAIVQSGSLYDEGFYVKPDRRAPIKLANYLKLNVTTTREAVRKLGRLSPRKVMSAALNLSLPMTVCKEKQYHDTPNFVKSDPFHLNNKERLQYNKIMIGYTSMELLYVYANQPQKFYDDQGDVFINGLQRNFNLKKSDLKFLSDVIKKFYLGGKQVGPDAVVELSRASSDFVVNHAVERSINQYMEVDPAPTVYKYVFSYTGGSPYKNINGSGASHTEELKYLFEWETPIVTPEQFHVRDIITTLWANFVKYGNPTPETSTLLPVIWEPVTGADRPFLNIGSNITMTNHVVNRQRMAFWDLFWHKYKKYSVVYSP